MFDKEEDNDAINNAIKNRCLSHHVNFLDAIFKFYKILPYLEHYRVLDMTQLNNTYHNKHHTYSVVLNAYEGSILHNLTDVEIKNILLAALYHDFNHTQVSSSDTANIKIALNGFKSVHEMIPKVSRVNDTVIDDILDTISSTKQPYPKRYKKNIYQDIIRDADRMTVYEKTELRVPLYIGMYMELPIDKNPGINTFIHKQEVILNSIKWFSHWGYVKALNRNYPNECKQLIKELTLQ